MKIAPPDLQQDLIDIPRRFDAWNTASARNAFGNAAQEICYRELGVVPIRINGNFDVCFDGVRDGEFFEIKSACIQGGKLIIYDWRLRKERSTAKRICYLVILQNCKGARQDIVSAMLRAGVRALEVPFVFIEMLARRSVLRIPKQQPGGSRIGYNRAGYDRGYRLIPVSAIFPYVRKTTFIKQILAEAANGNTGGLGACPGSPPETPGT